MAKKSIFWIPQVAGDSISGKFMGFERTNFKKRKGQKDGKKSPLALVLQTKIGKKLVTMAYQLQDKISEVALKCKGTDVFDISFDGKVQTGTGNNLSLFTVKYNGKELKGTQGFDNTASKSDLKEFFEKK